MECVPKGARYVLLQVIAPFALHDTISILMHKTDHRASTSDARKASWQMTRRALASLAAHIAKCVFPLTLVGPVNQAGSNQGKVASRLVPKGSIWAVRDKTTTSACLVWRIAKDASRRGHAKNVLQGIKKLPAKIKILKQWLRKP